MLYGSAYLANYVDFNKLCCTYYGMRCSTYVHNALCLIAHITDCVIQHTRRAACCEYTERVVLHV